MYKLTLVIAILVQASLVSAADDKCENTFSDNASPFLAEETKQAKARVATPQFGYPFLEEAFLDVLIAADYESFLGTWLGIIRIDPKVYQELRVQVLAQLTNAQSWKTSKLAWHGRLRGILLHDQGALGAASQSIITGGLYECKDGAKLVLLTRDALQQLPDGTVISKIDGTLQVKGIHPLDSEVRKGRLAFGLGISDSEYRHLKTINDQSASPKPLTLSYAGAQLEALQMDMGESIADYKARLPRKSKVNVVYSNSEGVVNQTEGTIVDHNFEGVWVRTIDNTFNFVTIQHVWCNFCVDHSAS